MFLKTVCHLCDLGDHGLLRVLSATDDVLTVETRARKQERIAQIQLADGRIKSTSTRLPLIHSSASDYSGSRWATATIKKRAKDAFDSIVTWQDHSSGDVHRVCIEGEKVISMRCPRDSSRLFIGTRRNEREGDGALYCFEHGQLNWTFRPSEKVVHPTWGSTDRSLVRAYPYRIVCPDDGTYEVFSFLNYVYVVDDLGHPIAIRDVAGLLNEEFNWIEPSGKSTAEIKISDELELELSIETNAICGPPIVQAMAIATSGRISVIGSRHAIVWLTDKGAIADLKELDIAGGASHRRQWTLAKLAISHSGRVVIAHVFHLGLFILVDGKHFSHWPFENLHPSNWAFCDESQIVAMKVPQQPRLSFCDLAGNSLLSVPIHSSDGALTFSDDGKFLFVSGGRNSVFGLSFASNLQRNISHTSCLNARSALAVDVPSENLNPTWEVEYDEAQYRFSGSVSDDGTIVAITSDHIARVFRDGSEISTIHNPDSKRRFSGAWPSWDGSRILAGLADDELISSPREGVLWPRFVLMDTKGKIIAEVAPAKKVRSRNPPKSRPKRLGTEAAWDVVVEHIVEAVGMKDGTVVWETEKHGERITESIEGDETCVGVEIAGNTTIGNRHYAVNAEGQLITGKKAELMWHTEQSSRLFGLLGRFLRRDDRRLFCTDNKNDVLWSLTANAWIHHVAASPSARILGFAAGTRVWIVTSDGKLIQNVRHKTSMVFPDDHGGFVAFSGGDRITYFSSSGAVIASIALPGVYKTEATFRHGLCAFTTNDGATDTVWVIGPSPKVVSRWRSGRPAMSLSWAKSAPILLVSCRGYVAALHPAITDRC